MIFLLLFFTVFVYLIFPILYVLGTGKVSPQSAKKIAIINSIVGATFFIFLRSATGLDAIGGAGFAPAVLYYVIAKAILTDKTPKTEKTPPADNTTKNTDNKNTK
jgi:hypothetical protein